MLRTLVAITALFLFPLPLLSAPGATDPGLEIAADLDILWVAIAAALVLLMQGGFLMLETGLVRTKNTINVAIKNLFDICLGMILFFLAGFGLMFGASQAGWVGGSFFLLEGVETPRGLMFFLFQATFMGTAATIVSGAVAERIRFNAYILVTIVIGLVIYPVFGHWAWGGGWLAELGFHDFAGSTVVHSVGGWIALAGVIVLGPRLHRFRDGKNTPIGGHDLPSAVLGAFLLWFGWFGFNGGSLLNPGDGLPIILVNTCLAASTGAVAAFLCSYAFKRVAMVEYGINGMLGGLVAITAGCDILSPGDAFLIGIVAGVISVLVVVVLENLLRLDDVVGAFAVHGACGIWGTLAVALFGTHPELSAIGFFLVQLQGVAVCAVWSFGLGLLVFMVLKHTLKVRVDPEEEEIGLNVAEHGTRTTWIDLMYSMEEIASGEGDLTRRLEIEHGTHVGAVADLFNRIQVGLGSMILVLKRNAGDLHRASEEFSASATQISAEVENQSSGLEEISAIVEKFRDSFQSFDARLGRQVAGFEEIRGLSKLLGDGFAGLDRGMAAAGERARVCNSEALSGKDQIEALSRGMGRVSESSGRVAELVNVLEDISDQLNLLSLNASIEAARSGDAGSGFAVVAREINKLAESTAQNSRAAGRSLEEVSASIAEGENELGRMITSFDTISRTVRDLDGDLQKLRGESGRYENDQGAILERLQTLLETGKQMKAGISDRLTEFTEIFNTIQSLSHGFEELTGQTEELNVGSQMLEQMATSLRGVSDKFKVAGEDDLADQDGDGNKTDTAGSFPPPVFAD